MESGAWEEYKTLQGKIDKIGEFHFLVRGWAVTLVAGLLVTLGAEPNAYELLVGIPLVGLFQLIEAYQERLQRLFGRRCFELEVASAEGSPRIARSIIELNRDMRRGGLLDQALVRVSRIFYITMYVLILGAFMFRSFVHTETSKPIRIEVANSARSSPLTINLSVAPDTARTKSGIRAQSRYDKSATQKRKVRSSTP